MGDKNWQNEGAKQKGCYKNKTKKRCAQFIFIVSLLLVVMGLFAGIYGRFGIDIGATWEIGDQKIPSPTALFGMLAIIVGIFVTLVGLLGLCAAKWKKCCFTMPFCVFSFILMIVMAVVAVIGIALAGARDKIQFQMCDVPGAYATTGAGSGETYSTMTEYMRSVYGTTVTRYMCSPICPCHDIHSSVWSSAYVEEWKAEQGRVYKFSQLDDDQKSRLDDNQNWLTWAPRMSYPGVVLPMVFQSLMPGKLNKKGGVFDNFKACYDENLKTLWTGEGADGDQKEFSGEGLDFFMKLEGELDCAGLCYKPLFGIQRNIKDGPPTNDCISAMLDTLSGLMAPSIVCVITFLILMCAMCGSIPLCSGFNEEDDDMMGEA